MEVFGLGLSGFFAASSCCVCFLFFGWLDFLDFDFLFFSLFPFFRLPDISIFLLCRFFRFPHFSFFAQRNSVGYFPFNGWIICRKGFRFSFGAVCCFELNALLSSQRAGPLSS